MKLKSTCSFAAIVGLAAAIAAPASAATIVTTFQGGPFGASPAFGTFTPFALNTANTYDFTFTVDAADVAVLTQLQAASFFTGSQALQYSLFQGTPGSGTLVSTSALTTGPSLSAVLHTGAYFLQIDHIATDKEMLSGGLQAFIVPEPASWGLMLLGLTGLGVALRRNRSTAGAAAVTA